jgi:hypothetical protein
MCKEMIRVKISTDSPAWPLIRQTPGSTGFWDDCVFFVNQDVQECDWWFVHEDLSRPESTICPEANIIFITGEPPLMRTYDPQFLSQFSAVITSHMDIAHKNPIPVQQALPWHIGIRRDKTGAIISSMGFDALRQADFDSVIKSKLVSVISSDKKTIRGHRKRLEFVDKLMAQLGDRVDFYGRGSNEVEDKWQAIAPYKYHIALENSSFPHYFTEKLSDAYLGWSYPIYYGCPNIHDYFPRASLTTIDISDPDHAVDEIEKVIYSDTFEKQIGQIEKARDLVLYRYNLFPFLAEYAKSGTAGQRKKIRLYPEKYNRDLYSRLNRMYRTVKHYGLGKMYRVAFERYL